MVRSNQVVLGEVRARIVAIDWEIGKLLAKRSRLVVKAMRAKKANDIPRRDPQQEQVVFRAAIAAHRSADGLYNEETITNVWQAICDGSDKL